MDYTLRTYSNRTEAELARGFLKTNGIISYLQADDAGGANPAMAYSGHVRLVVSAKDGKRAEKLLKLRGLKDHT